MRTINNLCAIIARRPDAVAFVNGSEKYKEIRGQVSFYELNDSVIVRAEVSGLPKGNGNCDNPIFAFHIHEGSQCIIISYQSFQRRGNNRKNSDYSCKTR